MVELKEIAIVFKRKVFDDDSGFEFIPYKVIEGYFDEDEEWFIDEEGNTYHHISELISSGNVYGARKTVSELMEKYGDLSLNEIKQKYLNRAKQYKYSRQDESEDGSILVKSIKGNKTLVFDDKDAKRFQEQDARYRAECEQEFKEYDERHQKQEEKKNQQLAVVPKMMSPYELIAKVKETIKGQDKAVETIVKTVWLNINCPEIKTKNLLVIGPTGVGKTAIFETLSKILDLPITNYAVPGLSQAGYVGKGTEDLLREILLNSDRDVEKASNSIVILDEIDKLAYHGEESGSVSTIGVQNELLKIIEGTTCSVDMGSGRRARLNTDRITFVGAGAFSEIYEGRIYNSKPSIGFSQYEEKEIPKKKIDTDELVKYGLKREFVGRMPIVLELNSLTEEILKEIISSEKGEYKQYIEILNKRGVICSNAEDFVELISKDALSKRTGARGLSTIITNIFLSILTEVMSNEGKYSEVVFGKNILSDYNDYTLIEKAKAKKRVKTVE